MSGIVAGWAAKTLVEVAMLPITYIAVNFLKRSEGADHYDRNTNFNPFMVLRE